MRPDTKPRLASATLLALLLAACGGGGGGDAARGGPVTSAPSPAPAPAPSAPPAAPAPAPPPAPLPEPTTAVPAGYALVWADEFDADGLPDESKWAYDVERNPVGWFNNELQYYARRRAENAVVADGELRITARLESLATAPDWGGQRYTSARLVTRGQASWTYGFFEIRARLPCGQGTWPAIWMLGTGGTWPDDGEIDIMEQVGSEPDRIFGTVHTRAGFAGASDSGDTRVATSCIRFHDYQMHWTADSIRFAVDGVEYHRYANPRSGRSAWPFDEPQYLLLNIAIGGVLGGAVDDSIFPVTLAVEHVRVFQDAR